MSEDMPDFVTSAAKAAQQRMAPTVVDYYTVGDPEQVAQLYADLAAASVAFGEPRKSLTANIVGKNKQTGQPVRYSYNYAPLHESLRATRPALGKNGLVVLQPIAIDHSKGTCTLHTVLAHRAGASLVSVAQWKRADDIKDLGGQITYMRRYSYNAILGLDADPDADDAPRLDGSEESAQVKRRSPPSVKDKPATKPKEQAPKIATTPAEVQAQLNALPPEEPEPEPEPPPTGDDWDQMSDKEVEQKALAIMGELGWRGKKAIEKIREVMGKSMNDLDADERREFGRRAARKLAAVREKEDSGGH